MNADKIEKAFPSYMRHIEFPACAKEQEITVYRACPTRKIERESFLNTYEENGFRVTVGGDYNDPQQFCLSTAEKLRDIRRFVVVTSRYQPPFMLAKGITAPACGVSCRTKEWKKTSSSHVDWWLYADSEPWKYFEEVDYEHERNR